jgi:hypothetical protein
MHSVRYAFGEKIFGEQYLNLKCHNCQKTEKILRNMFYFFKFEKNRKSKKSVRMDLVGAVMKVLIQVTNNGP